MKSGVYVRGWKFDWQEAKKGFDKYMDEGRDFAAACCADPGVCKCPECGEFHWREFEVFECFRCGAELTISNSHSVGWEPVVTKPPTRPEMRRKKLYDGMRVRFVGTSGTDIDGNPKMFPGRWPAGTIHPGECGTVRQDGPKDWHVTFDGRTPKRSEYMWGVFGPFLGDDFEEVD